MSTTAPDITGAIQLPPGIVGGGALAAAQLASGRMQIANPALTGSAGNYVLGPWVPSVPRFRPVELTRLYIPYAALTANTSGQPQASVANIALTVKVHGLDRFVFRGPLSLVKFPNLVNSMGNDVISADLVNPIGLGYGDEAEIWYAVSFDAGVLNWNFYLGIQLVDESGTEQAAPGAAHFRTSD